MKVIYHKIALERWSYQNDNILIALHLLFLSRDFERNALGKRTFWVVFIFIVLV